MQPKTEIQESPLLMVKGHTKYGKGISSEVLEWLKLWGITKDKDKNRDFFFINERES